jgi:hypothetical protein
VCLLFCLNGRGEVEHYQTVRYLSEIID